MARKSFPRSPSSRMMKHGLTVDLNHALQEISGYSLISQPVHLKVCLLHNYLSTCIAATHTKICYLRGSVCLLEFVKGLSNFNLSAGSDPVYTNMIVGCYLDGSDITTEKQRMLDIYMNRPDSYKAMNASLCIGACVTLGHRYAGIAVSIITYDTLNLRVSQHVSH